MSMTLKSIMVVAFTVGTMASLNVHADPGFHGGRSGHGHAHPGRGTHRTTPLQRMVSKLTTQTHGLVDEIDVHFDHKPRYQHVAKDAQDLADLADHIRLLVNRGSSGRHVRNDVAQMDELADHLDDLIHDMLRRTGRPQQIDIHFGHGVHVDFGRRERDGLTHVHEQVELIRRTLRQLEREMADYYPGVDRVLDQHHPANRPAVEVRPVVISPRSTGLNLNFRVR